MEEDIEVLDDYIEKPKKKVVKKKKKKKLKVRPFRILFMFSVTLFLVCLSIYLYLDKLVEQDNNKKIEEIASYYSELVKVTETTNLYDENENIIGRLYKGYELKLEETDINLDTKYFKSDLGYVSYKVLEKIDSLSTYDTYYKNYLVFNKNIVTLDNYTLYDESDNKIITFNKSDSYPIIINNYNNEYYGVEYNNRLVYIKSNEVKEVVDSNNTTKKNTSYITTLCYHRVNLENKCTDTSICIKQTTFDTQMKYLKDNNYLTITMEDMYMYLNGYVQFEKAVLVTLDDGWGITGAVEVFEKYKLHGVSFVGTIRIEEEKMDGTMFSSDTIEVQSHTHNMHRNYVCSTSLSLIGSSSQGGAILCASSSDIQTDISKSISTINGLNKKNNKVIALAYPYYDYSEYVISELKKTDIKMAFIGTGGTNGKAKVGTNLYKIPRRTIYDTTSFETWKGYL